MNKLGILLITLAGGLLITCTHNREKVALYEAVTTNSPSALLNSGETVEIPIDLSKSMVKWRGTKFFGAGSHEGTVRFEKGTLLFSNDRLVGGDFVVNMSSIYNTDIPKDDPIPRKSLTSHLHSDFETKAFPTASFTINKVEYGEPGTLQITGDMTIKGITNSITINAAEVKEREEYTVRFTFDRFDWGIGENGSWLEKKVVDAEIALTVEIYVSSGEHRSLPDKPI